MGNYKKTPIIYQMEATECGAASLSMIFAYYGKYIPLEQMRIETGVSRDGCNAANIMRASKKYGFECHGYRKDIDYLKEVKTPCIIHWNFNHFVVFEGFKGKNAYINDPAIGRRKVSDTDLEDSFTGIVLTFTPTDKFQKEKKKSTMFSFIQTRIKGQLGVLFKLFYIGLLLVFPGMLLPLLSQLFIDDVLVGGYIDWLTKILVCIGACTLLKFGLEYYRSIMLQKLKSKLTLISGHGFLRHMFRLPISFFDQRYVGDLVERMTNNTAVTDFLAGDLAETALNILVALFYLIILIMYSPLMTMICLINVGICLLVVFLSSKFISNTTIKMQMSGGKLYGAVCAGLSITDTIKASGCEQEYCSRILGFQAKQSNMEQEMNRFQQVINAIPGTVDQITDVMLLLTGGILAVQGQISIGMLVAFDSMFDSFKEPINSLVSFVRNIQTMKSNINRVEDIEKYEQDEIYDVSQPAKSLQGKLSGEVELRNISFGYSRLKPALIENFSFNLKCGETIAFIGASGCGKSTISKVISGLYSAWSGEVFFDGKELRNIPKAVLNASIATVSQNITLFSGSIRDNITMWNQAVLEEDMISAAKAACIHDFIVQQSGGYDYQLTEGASNLSGGQRQRLEIARALAMKPTILIMDEATSALDPIVEKQILDNIRMRGCTCIIVAHRLSAFRDCNHILVMQNGKIVQRGNHESLINEDGYYRTFVQNS